MSQEELILKRIIELLVAAGHVTEEQAEKARKLAVSLSPASPGPGGHPIKIEDRKREQLLNGTWIEL